MGTAKNKAWVEESREGKVSRSTMYRKDGGYDGPARMEEQARMAIEYHKSRPEDPRVVLRRLMGRSPEVKFNGHEDHAEGVRSSERDRTDVPAVVG